MTDRLRVVVVDDEPLAIERMELLLAQRDDVEVVGAAETGQAALALVERLAPEACLLDIGMPEMDGIGVARALGALADPPRIVFVTAFDRFAVAAFDIDAVDYLMKPVDGTRLERALERVRRHVARSERSAAAPEHLAEFWVSGRQGLLRIAAQDVDRITAERDYMRLHSGGQSWLVNDSLARLEEQLDPKLFVRLHRSALVRRAFVTGLRHDDHGWTARLADGGEQKVGRLYAENARRLRGRRHS